MPRIFNPTGETFRSTWGRNKERRDMTDIEIAWLEPPSRNIRVSDHANNPFPEIQQHLSGAKGQV